MKPGLSCIAVALGLMLFAPAVAPASAQSLSDPPSRVKLRTDGVTLLDGKPFFPLGVYEASPSSSASSRERLKLLADAGFNTVMNYSINQGSLEQIRAYLDAANTDGLKVIYSVKDLYPGLKNDIAQLGPWSGDEAILKGLVSTFRTHPSLLAWYVDDELPISRHVELLNHYRLVHQQDPDHPAWSVLYQVQDLAGYADTTDVIGVDPYPLPNKPLGMVADWTDKAAATGLPVWAALQIHDAKLYNSQAPSMPPSYDQMLCMTWLALEHGANGLVYYSFFDLRRGPEPEKRFGDVKRLVAQVKQAVPWLIAGGRGQAKVNRGVHIQTWRNGGQTMLVAVNPESRSSDVTVSLPAGVSAVTPLFGSESVSVQRNALRLHLAPLQVLAYRF